TVRQCSSRRVSCQTRAMRGRLKRRRSGRSWRRPSRMLYDQCRKSEVRSRKPECRSRARTKFHGHSFVAADVSPLQLTFEPTDGGGYKLTPSRASNVRFQSNLPEKPPNFLFAASTRWQGTRTGIGFAPHAPPTARTALGLPIACAISP